MTEPTPELRVNGSDTFKIAVADAIRGVNPTGLVNQYISLHSSDPLTTGAGEIIAVGRQKVTWNPAAIDGATGRAKISGNVLTFNIPAAANITHYGVWTTDRAANAAAGGGYLYGKALNPGANLTGAGTVTVTPSHSYGLV